MFVGQAFAQGNETAGAGSTSDAIYGLLVIAAFIVGGIWLWRRYGGRFREWWGKTKEASPQGAEQTPAQAEEDDARREWFAYIERRELPEVEADIHLPKGEVAHFCIECELEEEVTRTRSIYGGGSVAGLVPGSRIYFGKRHELSTETKMLWVDEGNLFVTNKRVIFIGSKKNISIPLTKILKVTDYTSAVQFHIATKGRPQYFFTSYADIVCAVTLLAIEKASE